jgi:hypothetical protein
MHTPPNDAGAKPPRLTRLAGPHTAQSSQLRPAYMCSICDTASYTMPCICAVRQAETRSLTTGQILTNRTSCAQPPLAARFLSVPINVKYVLITLGAN